MTTKRCSQCKQVKNLTEFRWKNKKQNVHSYHCKVCARALYKKHYTKNSADVIAASVARGYKYKSVSHKWKRLLYCVVCHESEPCCLDFHHLNPNDKNHTVSKLMQGGAPLSTILKECMKCVVLCSNCHRKVHNENIQITESQKRISVTIMSESAALVAQTEEQ